MEEGEIIEVDGKSVKFCGNINWQKTSIRCNKRVTFLVDKYHISSRDAKISVIESGSCVCVESNGNNVNKLTNVLPLKTTKANYSTTPITTITSTNQYQNDKAQSTEFFVNISLSLLATLVIMSYCCRKGILFVYALGFVILLYQSSMLLSIPQRSSFNDLMMSLPTNARIESKNSTAPVKVWYYNKDSHLASRNSTKIIQTLDKDEKAVLWILRISDMPDIVSIAAERMMTKLEDHSSRNNANQWNSSIRENITGYLRNVSQEELNSINPEWKLYIFDHSDRGVGPWGLWFMESELASLIGWKRINYITRTAQEGHHMDSWVTQSKKNPEIAKDFAGYFGVPINFTKHLGKACSTIQRKTYEVREDINEAIDNYMRENFPSTVNDGTANSFDISHAVATLPRPMDVRTFWNRTVCPARSSRCEFRSHLASEVASLPTKHPSMKVNTDVVGFIHKAGRNNVNPDYIKALLSTKIIVLGQRDKWEGHLRLMEALLSGALVLHDPQVYWPYGVVDGVNIVVYHSIIDLEEKILYYLDPFNERERIMIGQRGREIALSRNRNWQNMERLLLNDESKYVNDYGVSYHRWKGNGNP